MRLISLALSMHVMQPRIPVRRSHVWCPPRPHRPMSVAERPSTPLTNVIASIQLISCHLGRMTHDQRTVWQAALKCAYQARARWWLEHDPAFALDHVTPPQSSSPGVQSSPCWRPAGPRSYSTLPHSLQHSPAQLPALYRSHLPAVPVVSPSALYRADGFAGAQAPLSPCNHPIYGNPSCSAQQLAVTTGAFLCRPGLLIPICFRSCSCDANVCARAFQGTPPATTHLSGWRPQPSVCPRATQRKMKAIERKFWRSARRLQQRSCAMRHCWKMAKGGRLASAWRTFPRRYCWDPTGGACTTTRTRRA